MNKKQMWKITERKGLIEKANEFENNREKQRRCVRKKKSPFRSLKITDLETDETKYF